jgi:hypothetical protein
MKRPLRANETLGLLRPLNDAHSLGIAQVSSLLSSCGIDFRAAGDGVRAALSDPFAEGNGREIEAWIRGLGIRAIGFSYRLDPRDGVASFSRIMDFFRARGLLEEDGGPLGAIFFSGLPGACDEAERRFPRISGCFRGGEDPAEALGIFGLPFSLLGAETAGPMSYDEERLRFGKEIVEGGGWRELKPVERSAMPGFGKEGDGLAARVAYGRALGLPPLLRVHAGPYLPDRKEALELFLEWTRRLARGGLLDVLSIGTSQLSQERFGEDWGEAPNGGGVPVRSADEYRAVKAAAGSMLVRTYAGTRRVDELARVHEDTLDIAWHAFSLWWFSVLDGRGKNALLENLEEHRAAIRYAASTGKPVEPNVPHHFAFRGADDATYVASGLAAARFMRAAGLKDIVIQTMLNTPRGTWGVQDLAKARALLRLVRAVPGLRVFHQPRAGLDYFSADPAKAKAQLAASTALMEDIEPEDQASPPLIHVVSHSEASALADPVVIEESLKICRFALSEYRTRKRAGRAGLGEAEREAEDRALSLERDALSVVAAIEASVPDPWTPRGLELAFRAGFFPVPDLAHLREEYPEAVRWRGALLDGGVKTVDDGGAPVALGERLGAAMENARRLACGEGP